MHSRPTWHEIWMSMARLISQRSHDPRTQVGALIVTEDNSTLLSVGYNGNYSGGPHEPDSIEPGKSGFIHAEVNALIKAPYYHQQKKLMYVTVSPCINCAKLIITANISTVIYDVKYRDPAGLDLLKTAHVDVFQFS